MKQTLTASHVIRQVFEVFEHVEFSHTKWEEFAEPYHTYFAGISDEARRGEQNGSKMDMELIHKPAERKQMEKKVDGGGDIIEVH